MNIRQEIKLPCLYLIVPVLLVCAGLAYPALAQLEIPSKAFQARFENGGLVFLAGASGKTFVARGNTANGASIHLIKGDHSATATKAIREWNANTGAVEQYAGFDTLNDALITCAYGIDPASGDLTLVQHAESSEPGMWGVEWAVLNIPLDMNILVPGNSGMKLTRTSPGGSMVFDYPMSWEAQLVIVEGENAGFYVWAEDAKGVFKRLTVARAPDGWRLGFITMPYAPFDDKKTCDSVKWHVNVYEGDWRIPARRYREWAENVFNPTPVAAQQPEWIRDIRGCIIMDLDLNVLEGLPSRFNPTQTILYLPGWRKAGYDRDYPAYDAPVDELEPFIKRAHALGFRVMLHCNYFGCDPLNPLYAQFEPYQVRNPWGGHDKEWWLWTRCEPIIKFAYINPAYKPWRDLIVSRFQELCQRLDVDSLHLDQTLCIYNDHNGLIDGLSMLEGNVALHRELRAALPNVALSGEGLNEVTCRYEAFAQRHVWGINHADGTYSFRTLQTAHPISSYLLRNYTTMYGYLGVALTADSQLYAAWQEAYRFWGVIPTWKPDLASLKNPTDFTRQLFDETAFWMKRRVAIDLDAPWPPDVAFPFKTADGERVVRTADRRLMAGNTEISRTVTGVSEIVCSGSIPNSHAYDDKRIFALDPGVWYPCFPESRDLNALHVAALPEGCTVSALVRREGLAFIRTSSRTDAVIRLSDRLVDATCGTRPFNGSGVEVHGELQAPDGGQFAAFGKIIQAHPPYKITGTGTAYARFDLTLPKDVVAFKSDVAMDDNAVGENKTDGVTFGASVRAGDQEAHAEFHQAEAKPAPLAIDLRPFAGKQVALELTIGPGPHQNPTYDWARWLDPRIERDPTGLGEITILGAPPFKIALAGTTQTTPAGSNNAVTLQAQFPGTVFLLSEPPPVLQLPKPITSSPDTTTFVSDTGDLLNAPPHACATPGESIVGGVKRSGLFTHPPNQGQTRIDLPMTLPESPAIFRAAVGIRDGSKSTGVTFIVEANGANLYHLSTLPGQWHDVQCDLSPWAGKPVVLSLITDAEGSYDCDWALWADPTVLPAHP